MPTVVPACSFYISLGRHIISPSQGIPTVYQVENEIDLGRIELVRIEGKFPRMPNRVPGHW
jgi:hypothetical protein